MSLVTQIDQDLVTALKAGDEVKKNVLRYLKSSFKNFQIEQGKAELTDEDVMTLISREVKKHKESIAAFEVAGKPDLVKEEQAEIEVLQNYLPAQMSEEEVATTVNAYLAENPTTQATMGKAMGALSQQLKGKTDLGLVSKILRESLSE